MNNPRAEALIELWRDPKFDEAKVELWDGNTGKKVRSLKIPQGPEWGANIDRVAFARDGKSLALAYTKNQKIVVVDLASGGVRLTFGGRGPDAVEHLAFSPDGKTLAATVNSNHAVGLWDLTTGKKLRLVRELPANGNEDFGALGFSPDGTLLALSTNSRILLCDPETGKELGQLQAQRMAQPTQLAFTPDSKHVVAVSQLDQMNPARVWDVAQRQLVRTLGRYGAQGGALSLSPDGKTLAACNNPRVVRLWDVGTGHELFGEDQEHISHAALLSFTPDGKTLISAGEETFVWDAATGKRRAIVSADSADPARFLAISPDSKQLAWIGSRMHFWDLAASREKMVFTMPNRLSSANSVMFSPDGRKLFTLDCTLENEERHPSPSVWTHTVRLWDMASGRQERLWTIAPQHDKWGSLGSDGKTVLANAAGHGMKVYDLESGHQRLLADVREAIGPASYWDKVLLAQSWDGKVLASGRPGPAIRLWELATGKEILALEGHEDPLYAMAWSPNGRLLASGSFASNFGRFVPIRTSVRLWDTAAGKELARFAGKVGLGTVAFSPDGTKLAAALSDKADEYTIMILDITKYDPTLRPASKLSEKELESRWTLLADDSAGKAHAALWSLVVSPADSLPFLRDRLIPAAAADAGKIRRWIAELDDTKFAVREAAAKELKRTDGQVEPFLQEAMRSNPTLEARRRLEQILISVRDNPSRETVRTMRAIMALERIGTPPARAVLEVLARGAAGARETVEARSSLERMRHQAPK
jgi:WD40 repeat protein